MQIRIVITVLCLLAGTCFSRPIQPPTYTKLFEMSDLVAILSLERIEIAESVSPENPDPKNYQDYLAYCKIEYIFKGTIETNSIVIPFFQHPTGKPGFNGALPAPFTQKSGKFMDYIAYLKKSDGNRWRPAAGSLDAALSIKSMPLVLDIKNLELPKKKD